MSLIPQNHIIKIQLKLEIDNKSIEYKIKTSLYGDTYSIHCNIMNEEIDLLKLSNSNQYGFKDRKTIAFGRLIKYKLPLVLEGQISDELLLPLKSAIDLRKSEILLHNQKIKFQYLRNGWIKDYYKIIYQKNSFDDRNKKESILNLIEVLISHGSNINPILKKSKYEHAEKIISSYGYFIDNNINHNLYEYLGFFSNKENKELLKTYFKSNKNAGYNLDILKGLKYYITEDIYELLKNFYNKESQQEFDIRCNSTFNNPSYSKYLQYILNFHKKEIKEIAWNNLAGPTRYFTLDSYHLLRSFNVNQDEIFRKIRTNMLNCKRCGARFLYEILILAYNIPEARTIFSVEELLSLFGKGIQDNQYIDELRFTQHIGSFLCWIYNDSVSKELDKMLESESIVLRDFTFTLILLIVYEKKDEFILYPNTLKYLNSPNDIKEMNKLHQYHSENIFKYLREKRNIMIE